MAALKVLCVVVLSSILCEAAVDKCVTFGKNGLAEVDMCESVGDFMPKTLDFEGEATWAVELDSALAILIGNTVQLWTGGSHFAEIPLGNLTSPVGAVHLDGKLYVACFGSWPDPLGDSGLAIIDVEGQSLETTHPFSDGAMHVHNVYAFDFGGKKEIFAAILGNPWTGPLAGRGLSRFDRASGSFDLNTTGGRLNVRSAKQQSSDGRIFVLTQEPAGEQTKLASLIEVAGQLQIETQTLLPPRQDGDGGADVVLGFQTDTIWVTDRGDQSGMLYFYDYNTGNPRNHHFTKVRQMQTGANPRYAVVLHNGDIVVCNQNGNDLSVYKELANSPTDISISEVRVPTVSSPMFFMKTSIYDWTTPPPLPDTTPAPDTNGTTPLPAITTSAPFTNGTTPFPDITTSAPSTSGTIESTVSSLCVDLPGGETSNGALLWMWECDGGEDQQWSFQDGQLVYLPDPSKCMDLLGGDTTNGNRLGLWDCYGGASQLWEFDEQWGTIYLASSTASDASKCAQIGGENQADPLVIWDCTIEPSQIWTFSSLQSPLVVV